MFLFLRLKVFGQCFNWYMLDLFLLWHVTVGCALKQDHTKAVWFSKSVVTFHQLRCAGWPSAHSSTTWIAPVVGFSEVFYITFGAGCEVAETQLTGSKIIKPCYPFPFMYLDCQLQDQSPWELWMPTGAMLKNPLVSQIEVQIVSWLKSRRTFVTDHPVPSYRTTLCPWAHILSLRLKFGISSVSPPAWDKCVPCNR